MAAKDDAVKDALYGKLEKVYDKCPTHDVKIVLKDSNAKDSSASTTTLPVEPGSHCKRCLQCSRFSHVYWSKYRLGSLTFLS